MNSCMKIIPIVDRTYEEVFVVVSCYRDEPSEFGWEYLHSRDMGNRDCSDMGQQQDCNLPFVSLVSASLEF